jgi:hypothetical protein
MSRALCKQYRSRRGAASALIILLLVMLVIFGVLAMVSAAANLKLARRQADWNKAWYLADGSAEAVFAELDQLCRLSAAAGDDLEHLAGLIGGRLEQNQAVLTGQAASSDDGIRIEARIGEDRPGSQGIDMVLVWQPDAAGGRLQIEQWTQWQPPFDYGEDPGGVWEG